MLTYHSFVENGMKRAQKLLHDHEDELHKVRIHHRTRKSRWTVADRYQLAKALVDYETLNLDEVRLILADKPLNRPVDHGEKLVGEAERKGETGQVVDGI